MRTSRRWLKFFIAAAALLAALVAVLAWKPDLALQGEFARLRWQAGAEVTEVTAAEHRWSVLEAGPQDAPIIVLVHGFTGMKENWLPLMANLSKTYRVIAPDLPGWNDSQRLPNADYGVQAQADRLSQFISVLPSKPLLVVGHSMGGYIAGLYAAQHPESLSNLLLMSAAGVPFKPNAFTDGVLRGEHPFAVTNREQLHRFMSLVFTDPPWVPWPADQAIVNHRIRSQEFEQSVLASMRAPEQRFLLHQQLNNITMPTLLLWCKDDRVIDVSAAQTFAEGLSSSQTTLFDSCGHMPMMSMPQQVAQVIIEFVQKP